MDGNLEKTLVTGSIIQKMRDLQGMVEQSRYDKLISSALLIRPKPYIESRRN